MTVNAGYLRTTAGRHGLESYPDLGLLPVSFLRGFLCVSGSPFQRHYGSSTRLSATRKIQSNNGQGMQHFGDPFVVAELASDDST